MSDHDLLMIHAYPMADHRHRPFDLASAPDAQAIRSPGG
jgi:hypothetical protein